MTGCNLCARKCGVDREKQKGYCKMGDKAVVALSSLHYYEEPCISGENGSGTIFFSGCSLSCVFCQNYEISALRKGKEITKDEFIKIIQELEEKNANNINLVSPTHFACFIVEALKEYKPKIPVIWNSHGYETEELIDFISPYIDIYLVDYKYYDDDIAVKYSSAPKYNANAIKTIKKMLSKQPVNEFDSNGIMKRGIIIRHLILPSNIGNSIRVLDSIKENFKSVNVSLMAQYVPCGRASEFKEINRIITKREYDKVVNHYLDIGLDGYIQEFKECATTNFIPKF